MSKAEFSSTLRSVLLSSKACTTDCIWHLTWHYSVFFGCWLLLPSRSFHFCYVFVSCVFQMQIQHLPYRSFLPRSQNTYFLYCSKPWSVIVVSYIFSRNTSQLESTTIRFVSVENTEGFFSKWESKQFCLLSRSWYNCFQQRNNDS